MYYESILRVNIEREKVYWVTMKSPTAERSVAVTRDITDVLFLVSNRTIKPQNCMLI